MIVYVIEDNWQADTTIVNDFASDSEGALSFLGMRERELFPWDGPERVCYFRADSLDGLRQTHGNWFHRTVTVIER